VSKEMQELEKEKSGSLLAKNINLTMQLASVKDTLSYMERAKTQIINAN
jgi:hypothetical protein